MTDVPVVFLGSQKRCPVMAKNRCHDVDENKDCSMGQNCK